MPSESQWKALAEVTAILEVKKDGTWPTWLQITFQTTVKPIKPHKAKVEPIKPLHRIPITSYNAYDTTRNHQQKKYIFCPAPPPQLQMSGPSRRLRPQQDRRGLDRSAASGAVAQRWLRHQRHSGEAANGQALSVAFLVCVVFDCLCCLVILWLSSKVIQGVVFFQCGLCVIVWVRVAFPRAC